MFSEIYWSGYAANRFKDWAELTVRSGWGSKWILFLRPNDAGADYDDTVLCGAIHLRRYTSNSAFLRMNRRRHTNSIKRVWTIIITT